MLERYGVDNPGKSKVFVAKQKKTCRKRYGGNGPASSTTTVSKMKDTCSKKYGVDFATQIPHVRKKAWDNYVEKRGRDFLARNPIAQKNRKQALLNKYGTTNIGLVPELQEKARKNYIISYGAKSPFCKKEVQDKIKRTNMKKYGVEYPLQSLTIRNKSKNYPNKQEKFINNLFPEIEVNRTFKVKVALRAYKFPDFLVTPFHETKKVVEFFGDYWHSKAITGLEKDIHEEQIISKYKSVGIDCLVIWYYELKDIKSLKKKFYDFLISPVETKRSNSFKFKG